MSESPVVQVQQGRLRGRQVTSAEKVHYTFQGIPYAKPPTGSLRFRAPQPADSWEGIRDATAESAACAQFEPFVLKGFTGDEDCLYLNVYTPSLTDAKLPVMLFVHGGGFRFGSSTSLLYGGDYLVEKDVVVVTFNYRLGPLGFLCLNTPEVPGNAGLKDAVLALQWVKQNIKSFGGDPDNLTVFGNSAGSAITSLLMASPLTKSHITKAILQSGTALNAWVFQSQPIDNTKKLAKELGCQSSDFSEILNFLTTVPVQNLLEADQNILPLEKCFIDGIDYFAPVIEKEFPGVKNFLSESYIDILTSGRMADIPLIIGSTTLEVSMEKAEDDPQVYIPKDLNIEKNTQQSKAVAEEIRKIYFKEITEGSLNERHQLMSDVLFNIDIHRYIKYILYSSSKPIYLYKFDYIGERNVRPNKAEVKKPSHADELGYIFHMNILKDLEFTPQDTKLKERLVRLWTNFAKDSNPTPDQNHYLNVAWPPISKDTLSYLYISNELSIKTNPESEKMEFWENLYAKYYKIWEHPKTNEEETPEIINPVTTLLEETISGTTQIVEVVEGNNDEQSIVEVEVAEKVLENGVEELKIESNNLNHLIRANDPPEDDLPKNIGVNKFVNFYESLGGQK